ncbi:MAG: AraC family transcriptional regulator [Rikenellaceae bacterium]|jgi:AraC-like DNA-binding protein|nr:AraC family transcriptional regulator [Rikenellaceae bacterium]
MATEIPRYQSFEVLDPFGIEVNTFEELYQQEIAQKTIYDEHRASFFHIFRYRGPGNVHYIEERKIANDGDSLLLVNRDVQQRYSKRKCRGEMALFSLTFFGDTPEKLEFISNCSLFNSSYSIVPIRTEEFAAEVDLYFSLMRQACRTGEMTHTETMIMRNWVHNLMIAVERELSQRKTLFSLPPVGTCVHMQQFRELLDANFQEQKHVGFYAGQMGLSEKKLSSIVEHAHGISAKAYIKEKLLEEAVRRLRHTTLNQGEIAAELGFDFTYFVKFFHKHVGVTPAKFRQEGEG